MAACDRESLDDPRDLHELHGRARRAAARRGDPLSLIELAAKAGVPPRSLQRAHAETAGSSFTERLTRERLSAAAELLADQAIPVALIARLTGYADASSFARAFRRRYGLPPARFRVEARAARRQSHRG